MNISEAQLEQMMDRAAECGAKKALAAIGLHDEKAAADVRDMRSVMEAYRLAKSTAWTTFVRLVTAAVLAALIAGVGAATWPKH